MKYSMLLSFFLILTCNVQADSPAQGTQDFLLTDKSPTLKAKNLEKAQRAAQLAIGYLGSYALNFYEGYFQLMDEEMVLLKRKAQAFIKEAIRLDPVNAGGLLDGDNHVTSKEIKEANSIFNNAKSDSQEKDKAKNILGHYMARREAKVYFSIYRRNMLTTQFKAQKTN